MTTKHLLSAILLSVIILLITSSPGFSQNSEELRPTQPPRIPIADYGGGGHRILDFMYLHYSFEEFDLDGASAGFNYVNDNDELAYNFGAGFLYMSGSGTGFDIYNWNLPLNANLGKRVYGTKDGNSLMIFGGVHWTYTWLLVDLDAYDYDVYVYGPAYGPILGAKGKIKIDENISFIPFYIFQHAIFDLTVEVDGIEQDVDIDPVTSHIFGFDIQVGAWSIGAILDMLNNTDNDKITIMFTYDLDFTNQSAEGM